MRYELHLLEQWHVPLQTEIADMDELFSSISASLPALIFSIPQLLGRLTSFTGLAPHGFSPATSA